MPFQPCPALENNNVMTTSKHIFLTLLCALFLFCGCAKQPATPEPSAAPEPSVAQEQQEFSVVTKVIGIDQYDGGDVWGVNTNHGTFVVGPEVPSGVKSTVYEHLMDGRDSAVTIRYQEMPATVKTVAHRRITSIVIQDREYRLDY